MTPVTKVITVTIRSRLCNCLVNWPYLSNALSELFCTDDPKSYHSRSSADPSMPAI